MMVIEENIKILREKVAEKAEKAGKRPEDIKIVAVSKTFGVLMLR